jgi:hypothetical protein
MKIFIYAMSTFPVALLFRKICLVRWGMWYRYLNRIIISVEIIFKGTNGDYSQIEGILSTKPEGSPHLIEQHFQGVM